MNVQKSVLSGPGHDGIHGIERKGFARYRNFVSLLFLSILLAGCGSGGGGSGGGGSGGGGGGSGGGGDGGGGGGGGGPALGLDSSALIATVNLSASRDSNLAGDAEAVSWVRVIVDVDGDAMAIWRVTYVEGGSVTSSAAWASYYDRITGTWGSEQKIAEGSSVVSEPQAIFDENGDLFVFGRAFPDWWWNKFSPSTGWEGQGKFPDDVSLTPIAITALKEVIVRDGSITNSLSRYSTDTDVLVNDIPNAGITWRSDDASASRSDGEVVMAAGMVNSGAIHARIRQYSPVSGWGSEMQTLDHQIGAVGFEINSVTKNADGHIAVLGTATLNLSTITVLAAYYDGSQWMPWQVLDEVSGFDSVFTSSVRMDAHGRVIALWDKPSTESITKRRLFVSTYNSGMGWGAPEEINVSSGMSYFNRNFSNQLGVDDVFTMSAEGHALVIWSSGSIWKNQFNPLTSSWEGESLLIEDSSPHPGAPRFFAISAANVNASGNGFLVTERRVTDAGDPFKITAEIRAIPIAIP